MSDKNPIEYSGKVLDQRNTLTAPDAGADYPERPKNVPIKDSVIRNKGK